MAAATFGMPKTTDDASSWAMVNAPASRMASRPSAPSRPMPVRITPMPLAPAWRDAESKSTSMEGLWPETGTSSERLAT